MKKELLTTAALAFGLCATASAQTFESRRPAEGDRLFTSEKIEQVIDEVTSQMTNPKLAWMFRNCFPNTLDTTVHYRDDKDGNPDTFVYTGDIHAMWLRDSGAQVWPYVQFAAQDEHLRRMIAGVINRQFLSITIDPYANAFNDGPTGTGWTTDNTAMNPNDHERKWEIDSQCYPIRLAHEYWKVTGDTSVFGDKWTEGMKAILATLREQQRKEGHGSYVFTRVTDRPYDTKCCDGLGNPVKPCGLIASAFRPSDDATVFEFLVPSNFFAVSSLRKAAEILETVNHDAAMAGECRALADEVETALKKEAVVCHPKFGNIYAFEVDGFGNHYLMDDANVPSLLALAYLGDVASDDPTYRNTRRFVLSDSNPYFFKGTAGEGIGGPHIGYDMIWPMSIMMRAFTSTDDNEIRDCIVTLLNTDAGTGFMHESFHKDNPEHFTRAWFAWQNTLFGELILKLIHDGKLDLLNSIGLDSEGKAVGLCRKPGRGQCAETLSPHERCEKVSFKDQGIVRDAFFYRPDVASAASGADASANDASAVFGSGTLVKGAPGQTVVAASSDGLPLVVVLHGYGGHALGDGLRFMELADLHGFAVCWPQGAKDGTGHSCWNVGYPFQSDYRIDDTAYLRRLIKHLQKNYGVSRRNVFLTGMSNGGEMCYKMAAEHPETFSAIASIAGLTLVSMSTDYRRPVPFMEVHGTDDAISNWCGDPENRGGWGAYLSVPAALSHIISANRCVGETVTEIPAERKRVLLHRFSGGLPAFRNGPSADVLLYEVIGGDHSWSDRYIPTCDLVWDFFMSYMR